MRLLRPKATPFSLLDTIAGGEGISTEFKRTIHSPAKIARSIAAFANTSGGHILIGVDDDRRIVGIRSEKEIIEVIDDALQCHLDPIPVIDLLIAEYKRRMVLVVDVPESPERPHCHIEELHDRQTGKYRRERRIFIREGSHNKAADENRIAQIISQRQPLRRSFSDRESRLLSYLAEHARITAAEFADQAGIPIPEARRILASLARTGAVQLLGENGSGAYALC